MPLSKDYLKVHKSRASHLLCPTVKCNRRFNFPRAVFRGVGNLAGVMCIQASLQIVGQARVVARWLGFA